MDEIYSPTLRFEIPLKNGYLGILLFYFREEDNRGKGYFLIKPMLKFRR
jgi:hypothetical protein